MPTYLVDENLPTFLPIWKNKQFIHVTSVSIKNSDTGIWRYAMIHKLVIITKDSDFYYRYLSAKEYPKVVWIKTGNMKNKAFNSFLEAMWVEIEDALLRSAFIIVDETKIEGF